jgi:hypothetical protein
MHPEPILACMLRLQPSLIKEVDGKGNTILHQLMQEYHPRYSHFQVCI